MNLSTADIIIHLKHQVKQHDIYHPAQCADLRRHFSRTNAYGRWHIEYTACLLQQLFLIFNYMPLFLHQQFVLKMGNYAVQMYFLIIGCHLFFLFFHFKPSPWLLCQDRNWGRGLFVCVSETVQKLPIFISWYLLESWEKEEAFHFCFIFGSPLIKLHNRALVEENYIFFVEQKLLSYIFSQYFIFMNNLWRDCLFLFVFHDTFSFLFTVHYFCLSRVWKLTGVSLCRWYKCSEVLLVTSIHELHKF